MSRAKGSVAEHFRRRKDIDLRYHHVLKMVLDGGIRMGKVNIEISEAHILTKVLEPAYWQSSWKGQNSSRREIATVVRSPTPRIHPSVIRQEALRNHVYWKWFVGSADTLTPLWENGTRWNLWDVNSCDKNKEWKLFEGYVHLACKDGFMVFTIGLSLQEMKIRGRIQQKEYHHTHGRILWLAQGYFLRL